MRHLTYGGILLLLALGLAPASAGAAPPPDEQAPAVMSCGDCHDQAKAFVANPHARGEVKDKVVPNSVCETCHGDGAAHIESGGEKDKIVVPRGLKGAGETCVLCHDITNDRRSHRTGAHANSNAVNCLSCHSIHSTTEPVSLLAKPQPQLCATCHGTQAASFRNKAYTHRMGRAGLGCTTCHDPHGRPGKDNLKLTKAGEAPCLGCHADKRGPFVFEHGGKVAGDCINCHEAHGSNNPKQLKRATVASLCLECHSPLTADTLGSQPPSFHNLSQARYQNCTTCHVAVHGSNRSPQLLK
ncbi:MAG TPA: DmsE family decaheme c-type cytochrome [Thermoanaerobaculia bacterium]|nr:DmsE family decaheme c-type cytochrome [Thermoanaerobaculia bacterium]